VVVLVAVACSAVTGWPPEPRAPGVLLPPGGAVDAALLPVDRAAVYVHLHGHRLLLWVASWVFWAPIVLGALGVLPASPGSWVCRLRIVDGSGNAAPAWQRVLRGFATVVSIASLGLGAAWILVSRRQRGWHDVVARTFVATAPVGPPGRRRDARPHAG